MFYWVRVHHHAMGDKEELFDYTTIGFIHMQEFLWLHLESHWEVKEIKLMNDTRKKG